MAAQLLRISDFDRSSIPHPATGPNAAARGRVFQFPVSLPRKSRRKSSARLWQRALDTALRIEIGCVLLFTALWLLRNFIR